jgi:hypothetical protein
MNINTTESWKYSNYNFKHIIVIAGKPYGVRSDGLYLLAGDKDIATDINGTVTSKCTDFGTFKSKRLQNVYLSSDTQTSITPIVDDVIKLSHLSSFSGRKTKMSAGNVGRYWQLKIEHIKELTGIEFLPVDNQRRIK